LREAGARFLALSAAAGCIALGQGSTVRARRTYRITHFGCHGGPIGRGCVRGLLQGLQHRVGIDGRNFGSIIVGARVVDATECAHTRRNGHARAGTFILPWAQQPWHAPIAGDAHRYNRVVSGHRSGRCRVSVDSWRGRRQRHLVSTLFEYGHRGKWMELLQGDRNGRRGTGECSRPAQTAGTGSSANPVRRRRGRGRGDPRLT